MVGAQSLLAEATSGPGGAPGPCEPLLVQRLICPLCALLPIDCPPVRRHLTAWPLLGAPLSQSHKNAAVGSQGQVALEDSTQASYLRCVLVGFVFSICRCPRTKASATDRRRGEMAWPGAKRSARWLGRGGCCMRWADNTPQRCKQDTPPSRSHPASAPAACCFVMACHDTGVSSQIGEPIVSFSSPFLKSETGTFQK